MKRTRHSSSIAGCVAIAALTLVACNQPAGTPEPQLVPTRTRAPRPTATVQSPSARPTAATPTAPAVPLTGLTLENAERLARVFQVDEPPPRHIYSVADDRLVVFTSRTFEVIAADTLDLQTRTPVQLGDKDAPIFWYAASPDGKVGAIMQLDGTVDIYDLGASKIVKTLTVPRPSAEVASDIALNEDGSELVVISQGELRRIRLADAEIVGEGQTLPQTTQAIRFSEDASRVAAVQLTGEIVIVNAITGAPPVTLTVPFTATTIEYLSFNPTGTKFGASGEGGLAIWDLSGDAPRLQKSFADLGAAVEPTFDRTGRFMAVIINPTVLLYDLQDEEPRAQFRLAGNLPVWSVNFDPRGERLFLAGSGELASFDILAGKALQSATRPPVTRGAFSADGDALFTWSAVYPSNDVAVFDARTWEVRGRLLHDAAVAWVVPDSVGRYVATLTLDRGIHIWRARDGELMSSIAAPVTDTVRMMLCFAPDGRSLAYLDGARVVSHDVASDREASAFELPFEPRFISECDNDEGIFAAAGEQDIRIFDLDGRVVATIGELSGLEDAGALYLSDDGARLAVLTPRRLTIWDVKAQKELQAVRLQRDPLSGVFSPRGDRFALNFGDDVDVLDIASGKLVSLDLPKGSSASAFFPPDSRLIVTVAMIPTPETAARPLNQRAFTSGELSIWNAQTGELVRRIEAEEPLSAGSISGDGELIVASTRLNSMTVWGVQPAR